MTQTVIVLLLIALAAGYLARRWWLGRRRPDQGCGCGCAGCGGGGAKTVQLDEAKEKK
jgi:hypothetical protein